MDELKFVKKNANPKTHTTGDCVIRALSLALNQQWEETFEDLCKIAKKKCRMPNDQKVYESYLINKGWSKCSEPRNFDNTKMLIKDAVPYIKEKQLIIYAGSRHITYVEEMTLYDTWDCRRKTMHTYWRKL